MCLSTKKLAQCITYVVNTTLDETRLRFFLDTELQKFN